MLDITRLLVERLGGIITEYERGLSIANDNAQLHVHYMEHYYRPLGVFLAYAGATIAVVIVSLIVIGLYREVTGK